MEELHRSASPRAQCLASSATVVAAVVFCGALFGILTRSAGFLAAFWPANALLVALFVRRRDLAGPAGWLGAIAGYVAADLLTGGTLARTAWLTLANLAGVATAYGLLSRLSEGDRSLKEAFSLVKLCAVCVAAAAAAAAIGAAAASSVMQRDASVGFRFWFTSELATYLIVLPVALTLPSLPWRRAGDTLAWPSFTRLLPALLLALSVIASLVAGGPAALVFPIPALILCALNYSLFGTAVLTMVICAWQLHAVQWGIISFPLDEDPLNTLTSLRLAVSLVALGPLTVAGISSMQRSLLSRLDRLAHYDSLTDALARGAFLSRGQDLIDRLGQARHPVAVLMIDLDHFKSINDRHGHLAGDRALATFAEAARGLLRSEDLFGRVGGEEFAVILPRLGRQEAMAVAGRLREAVGRCRPPGLGDECVGITVSIGLAFEPNADGAHLERLLVRADGALYQAKRDGRNRVAEAPPVAAAAPYSE